MTRLLEKYRKEVIPLMKEKFGYKNIYETPKVVKVVLSIGTGKALKDSKLLDIMRDNLKKISGQAPVKTFAKRSISGFNVKEGNIVGLLTTLRGERMYEFLNKLINVALPRFRDFQGLPPEGFDKHGNYNIGIKEQLVFPELRSDEVEKIHGLSVNITTTAKTDKEGIELLKGLGFIFSERGLRAKEEALKEVAKKESVLKRYEEMKKKQKMVAEKADAKTEIKEEGAAKSVKNK